MNKLNAVSSFLVLVSGTATNFFLTPFFISKLGVEGMVVIRAGLTIPMYAMLITIALLGPLGRYYVVSYKKGDLEMASQTLSTAMISLIVFFTVTTPFFILFSSILAGEFDIGGSTSQISMLFVFMFFQSVVVTFSAVLSTPSYSLNRVFVYNFSKLIVIALQTLLTVFALTFLSNELTFVGVAFFLASLCSLAYTAYFYRRDSGDIIIALSNFRWSVLRKLADLGRWTAIDNLGAFFLLSFDLFFVTFLLGQLEAGRYAIYLQLAVAVITVSKALIIIYGPKILSFYAEEQYGGLYDFYCLTIKHVAFLCAAISGAFYAYAPEFINLWLGNEFVNDARLYSSYIVLLGFTLTSSAASFIFSAYCKVKAPALVSVATGLVHPALAYVLAVIFNLGIEGFMISMAVVFAMKNIFFVSWYVSKLTTGSIYKSVYTMALYIPLVIITLCFSYLAKALLPVSSFFEFIFSIALVCGLQVTVVYFARKFRFA